MKSALAELGVPPAQIRSEAFEAAVAMSTAADNPQERNATSEHSGCGFALRLIESGTTLAARPGTTILETCEEAGVLLPVVCRAGACGSCRTRLAKGRVRCESETLGADDRAAGYILPCVSWPEEDCALEA
jgi:ferredoxin